MYRYNMLMEKKYLLALGIGYVIWRNARNSASSWQ